MVRHELLGNKNPKRITMSSLFVMLNCGNIYCKQTEAGFKQTILVEMSLLKIFFSKLAAI